MSRNRLRIPSLSAVIVKDQKVLWARSRQVDSSPSVVLSLEAVVRILPHLDAEMLASQCPSTCEYIVGSGFGVAPTMER